MTSHKAKQNAARAAMDYVEDDMVIGVGTGSTVNYFIEQLANIKHRIEGTVASSKATELYLRERGIRVLELNDTGNLPIYIDGADECDPHKRLIKGGGGALTREKIVAAASDRFVCIIDESKLVDTLGEFPLPVEVLPMAQSYVGRQLVKFGGRPALRTDFTTDNGNVILDVHALKLTDPVEVETALNQIPGVVSVGLFAQRPADIVIVGNAEGAKQL